MSSEDIEMNEDTDPAAEESVSSKEDEQGAEETTKEIDSLMKKKDEEIALLKDQVLRSRADFDNFRKRCIKTEELNKKLAVKDFALDIIKVHDDFIRASEAAMSIPEGDTLEHAHKSYVDGVMMISRNIESALGNNGVSEVESLNAPFNPVFHEAVAFDTSDSVECDTVTKVFQKGFVIDQMVIRTAKVMVTKPEKKGPENSGGCESASEANTQ